MKTMGMLAEVRVFSGEDHPVHPRYQASLLLLKHSCFHTPITPVCSSTREQEHLPFSYLVLIGTPTPVTPSVSSPSHLLFSTKYSDFGQHAHRLILSPPNYVSFPSLSLSLAYGGHGPTASQTVSHWRHKGVALLLVKSL